MKEYLREPYGTWVDEIPDGIDLSIDAVRYSVTDAGESLPLYSSGSVAGGRQVRAILDSPVNALMPHNKAACTFFRGGYYDREEKLITKLQPSS